MMITPELENVNGLMVGTNREEFFTFGLIEPSNLTDDNPYFSNFNFLGPKYRDETEIKYLHAAHDYTIRRHWSEAFRIDPKNHTLVIDAAHSLNSRFQRNNDEQPVKLFKVELTYKICEVNTHEDEYSEIRRWRALSKLTVDEIKLLGLEDQMVYLKLKYSENTKDENDDLI
jgi:hypothetical protein